MKINGIVKGEYKKLCPVSWHRCKGNKNLLEHKIRRAVDLGKKLIRMKTVVILLDKVL